MRRRHHRRQHDAVLARQRPADLRRRPRAAGGRRRRRTRHDRRGGVDEAQLHPRQGRVVAQGKTRGPSLLRPATIVVKFELYELYFWLELYEL